MFDIHTDPARRACWRVLFDHWETKDLFYVADSESSDDDFQLS